MTSVLKSETISVFGIGSTLKIANFSAKFSAYFFAYYFAYIFRKGYTAECTAAFMIRVIHRRVQIWCHLAHEYLIFRRVAYGNLSQ